MNATLTVELPEDIQATLGVAAREDGVSEKAMAVRALRDYLFLRRFRKLRVQMSSEAEKTYSDDEIFDLLS